jgi:hypothetical protein
MAEALVRRRFVELGKAEEIPIERRRNGIVASGGCAVLIST